MNELVLNDRIWDIVVVGGGVVGCAMARRFTLSGAKVLLVEKGPDILSGASKANSAILHTGFDAPPNSVELACIQRGYEEYLQINQHMNLPLLRTEALVVAWSEEQLSGLDGIVAKAHANGVHDVVQISKTELHNKEPGLNSTALGAVHVPREMVIDPWNSPLAYLTQALRMGAEVRFNTEVMQGDFDGNVWSLNTNHGRIKTKLVINCSGNQGDIVERICAEPDFEIRPRKGQFLVYDKSAASLINAIILPVPTKITKGVVLTKTMFGNLLLGPTAEEQTNREEARVERERLEELIVIGSQILPDLPNHEVTATYAGLRPATEHKDYQIKAHPTHNWIGVNGIRSTGLSSALGIATYVEKLCQKNFPDLGIPAGEKKTVWPKIPNLAEHLPRAYKSGDGTEIVCHCESVTRGDIERALDSEIPAKSLGGLRRRTRVMMGRCNGFYCSAKVASLCKDHITPPLDLGGIDG